MGVGYRHTLAALHPTNRPGTHCIGGWVGPRAGLYELEKSPASPTGIRSLNRPTCSESLSRLDNNNYN